jgi:hypothetical protein
MIALIIGATKRIEINDRQQLFQPTLTTSAANMGGFTSWTASSNSEEASGLGIFCLGESRVVHNLFSLLQQKQLITSWQLWTPD